MKQNPKTFKFRRVFRKKTTYSILNKHLFFTQYKYALKAMEPGKLTYIHLKMMDLIVRRLFKKNVNYRINVSMNIPVSAKPLESRMGTGKGRHSHWECVITKGMIILEIYSVNNRKLLRALNLISQRLPFKVLIKTFMY